MSTISVTRLGGQDTLVASWRALAALSTGARVVTTPTSVAAVFPDWGPLNNAILTDEPGSLTASVAAAGLKHLYRSAGVETWALWVPASTPSLGGGTDRMAVVGGMRRDATTLAMRLTLGQPSSEPDGVVRTSISAAGHAGDEPVPALDLPRPDDGTVMDAWVLVRDGWAVAGAWSLISGTDCGIYAVGTAPEWRGRGLAHALMLGVLGDAFRRGARSASLQSTPMGEPLYTSLGFYPVGRYEEWVPEDRNERGSDH